VAALQAALKINANQPVAQVTLKMVIKQISQQPPPAVPSAKKLPPLPQLQPGN